MLEELHIQNFALIDRLVVRFAKGFNVLTGETGAGKSILIGALSLVLGAPANKQIIRSGSDECIVSALFSLREGAALRWCKERGIPLEDHRIIIRRSVRRERRGTIYIQSVPVSRNELQECSALLINIHGQHEYQSLANSDQHRQLLDGFGGFSAQAAEVRQQHAELTTIQRRFETLNARGKERSYELELLQHAVEEIEQANILEGEEQELEQEIRKLNQHEKLNSLLHESMGKLSGYDGGSLSILREVRSLLEQAAAIDQEMVQYSQRADSIFFDLEEIARSVSETHRSMRFSKERLREAQQRYDQIMTLKQKYGGSVAAVQAYAVEAQAQIEELASWEENRERLTKEISQRQAVILKLAQTLSEARRKHASQLASQVHAVVCTLGMPHAQFEVRVTQRTSVSGVALCGPSGIDIVEFYISSNLGEAAQKLQEIASGGELSRIMLAIKTVLAATEDVESMIFDEVDAGIGGEVALSVGEHLGKLAASRQVICITHIASIAARADTHLLVEKQTQGERTVTKVQHINDEQREIEISRMLAGNQEARASRAHALELLQRS